MIANRKSQLVKILLLNHLCLQTLQNIEFIFAWKYTLQYAKLFCVLQ